MPVLVIVRGVRVEVPDKDVIGSDLQALFATRTAVQLLGDAEAEAEPFTLEGLSLNARPAIG